MNAEDLRRDMALHYGAADNSADLVQLLVRSGARINGRGGECSCSRSSPQLPQCRTFLHFVFRTDWNLRRSDVVCLMLRFNSLQQNALQRVFAKQPQLLSCIRQAQLHSSVAFRNPGPVPGQQ